MNRWLTIRTDKVNFLYKLIIGLLLMAVLPTSLTVYVLHRHYAEGMLTEVGAANKRLLDQAKMNGDMMFNEMAYMASVLLNHSQLPAFMQEEYSSDAKSFNDLMVRLDTLRRESRYLSGIYLYFDRFDYMIGSDSHNGAFFHTIDEMSAAEKELTQQSALMHQPRFLLQDRNGRRDFVMIRPVQNAAYRNVGSIALIVDESRFADIFAPLRLSELDTTLVLDASGNPLWCNGASCSEATSDEPPLLSIATSSSAFGSEYTSDAPTLSMDNSNADYRVVNRNGNAYAVSDVSSEVSRWQFVSMLPMERLTSRLSVANQLTLFVLLSTLAVAIGCAFVYGRYLYRPVRKLLARVLPHAAGKPRDNEFRIIGEAYRHALDGKADLERFLVGNRRLMIGKLLQRVMTGQEMDPDAIAGQLSFLDVRLSRRFFTVVLIGGFAPRSSDAQSHRTKAIAQLAWLDRAERALGELSLDGLAFELDPDSVAVLLNTDDAEPARIADFVLALSRPDPELPGAQPTLGRGETADGLGGVYESYRKARYELACQSGAPDVAVAPYPSDPISLYEKKIGHALVARDLGVASSAMEELFERIGEARSLSWPQVLNVALKLLSTALARLEDTNLAVYQDFMRRALFYQLARLESEQELRTWLARLLAEMIDRLNEAAEGADMHPKIRQSLRILHEEYESELTLENVADRIGLNPAYLSKLFKDETSFNFIDYVNRMRIDYGKSRLLDRPDLSLEEIAQSVGYNNTQSFTRFFKKYEGCTPGQFRQQAASSR